MTLAKYPKYKVSDSIGPDAYPAEWEPTQLKYLVALNPPKSAYLGAQDTACSFIPMEKLKTGTIQLDEVRLVAEVFDGYTYFEDGDILQAKVTPCFENKNVSIAAGLVNGVGFGSSEINVLRPRSDANARFLYYRIQEVDYMGYCTANMLGAGGLKRVPTEIINGFQLAVPSIHEQIQIARFLDHETAKIDALIAEQQRLIELLKEKRQAVISHAVTKGLAPNVPMKDAGVDWLGEVPAHWDVAPVSYRYNIQLGRMLNEDRIQGPNLRPYLRVADVQWREINVSDLPLMDFPPMEQSLYQLIPGDLLVNEGGSYVGRSAIWNGELSECYYQKALHRLRPIHNDKDYTPFMLNVMEMAANLGVFVAGGNQTTIDHLTTEQLRRYRFAFPPFSEQKEISELLEGALKIHTDLTDEANSLILLLRERRAALISAAVTGKIDVRNWKPPTNENAFDAEVQQAGRETPA